MSTVGKMDQKTTLLCSGLEKKEDIPSDLGRWLYGRESQRKVIMKLESAIRAELLSIYAYDLCFTCNQGPFPLNSSSV